MLAGIPATGRSSQRPDAEKSAKYNGREISAKDDITIRN